jgi:predicted alpha/beta hydrolase
MAKPQAISFHAPDGVALRGAMFEPAGTPRSAVLIAGGLGIPQRFYAPFASWLAERGHRALTFDPRGIGASRLPPYADSLRGLKADMLTWARQDFAGAVSYLGDFSADGQIALIGHSMGMHHACVTDALTQGSMGQVVSVAAGAGYWRDWAPASRRRAPLLLHFAVPILTPVFGYFPGKRLRVVGDIPGPAITQWSRWCRHPEFAWGADPELVGPSLDSARFPIHAFSFTDDEAITEVCTRKMLLAMANAPSTLQVLSPEAVGMKSVGHVGAFRPEASGMLWPLIEARIGMGAS